VDGIFSDEDTDNAGYTYFNGKVTVLSPLEVIRQLDNKK
jgi:hypothetical protein